MIIKMMLYNSHPIADILKESLMYTAMTGDRKRSRGCTVDRGRADAYYGRGYDPHKRKWQGPHDVEFMSNRQCKI